ncbi:ESX secretion-associated protein EspG [Nocardia salmonicida]|uniref:ESX secretion-associated protein EspG n=1 Tax=Nocardia salmonicida TaxID=53431 RepID=UPI00340CFF79
MTTLTVDGVLTVANILGVQVLPPVLAVRNTHRTPGRFAAARAATLSDLRADGVLDDEHTVVDDDLAAAFAVLARPERALVLRLRRAKAMTRVCLARRGFAHAIAIRAGDGLDVRSVWGDEDPVELAKPLVGVLGRCPPADVPTLTAPTDDLRARFDDPAIDHAEAAYHLGLSERDATTLGLALRERTALGELVCYHNGEGTTAWASRAPATAAVYDTPAGRVIAGGRIAEDGRAWTTLAPGSDRRLVQVIAAIIESLPTGRWMP